MHQMRFAPLAAALLLVGCASAKAQPATTLTTNRAPVTACAALKGAPLPVAGTIVSAEPRAAGP
ncbi:MAG: hypothetical protein J0I28_11415, partial [Caulobacterales bacterium]|nr:hypothetical protein [Caulobacterales bacterium]